MIPAAEGKNDDKPKKSGKDAPTPTAIKIVYDNTID